MKVLLFSSILYLIGVVAVLMFKPELMFTEDGTWKEFGLVNDPKYTFFPFWLFCIVWALLSFALARIAVGTTSSSKAALVEIPAPPPTKNNLKKGYYVLNREASEIEGVPRYVYIGAEEPSD